MSLEYQIEGTSFSISYQDIKESYLKYTNMNDEDFLADIPGALHTACVICFFKEIPTYVCLSDKGIIHELSHILHLGITGAVGTLREIRELFERQLKLA